MAGDPEAIWQRGNLPMYLALSRYWSDHPRLDQIAAAYFKIPQRYTAPPPPEGEAPPLIDWSLLDMPEEPAGAQRVEPLRF